MKCSLLSFYYDKISLFLWWVLILVLFAIIIEISTTRGVEAKSIKNNHIKISTTTTIASAAKIISREGINDAKNESSSPENAKECCSCSAKTASPRTPSSELCLTEECILAASTVLSSLDRSVDPCEDFYSYACGGWIQNAISSNSDRFQLVDKRNQNAIKKLLEVPPTKSEDLNSAVSKAKNFYLSCMNMSSAQEKIHLNHLIDLMEGAGGWHLTGTYNSNFTFDQRVQILQNDLGVDVFFTWGVIEQDGQKRLAIIAGGWNDALAVEEEEDREQYLTLMTKFADVLKQAEQENIEIDLVSEDDNLTADYLDSISDINEISDALPEDDHEGLNDFDFGNEDHFPQFKTKNFTLEEFYGVLEINNLRNRAALRRVIAFEDALGNITKKPMDSTNLVPYNISQLSNEFLFLNWTDFFHSAFMDVGDTSILNPDTEVLIQEDFVRGMNDLVMGYLVDGFETGNITVLENYMIWRVVASYYPETNHMDEDKSKSYREDICVKQTEDTFAPAVTSLYINAKGIDKSEKAQEQVTKMVRSMQDAFRENLDLMHWMSPESRESAKAKLEHMVDLIGFPAFVLNDTWLNQAFEDLDIKVDSYLKNVANHKKFSRMMEVKDFFQPPVRGTWNSDFSQMGNIANVNAYYNQATNTMVVPIGMLQPPLFWSKPKSLTFGAFGIVVAHEITHAFDEVGIMYDSQAQFKPLYDNSTIKAFHNASDCIRKQYSTFSLDGVQVDGNVTLGENIADHGGLRIAEIAYENWLNQNNGFDASLPALDNFTPFQLFYLGYALPWCAVHSDSMLRHQVLKDEHAPDRFRVLGPLSNSEKFSKVWGCSTEKNMNPIDKCNIWGDYKEN